MFPTIKQRTLNNPDSFRRLYLSRKLTLPKLSEPETDNINLEMRAICRPLRPTLTLSCQITTVSVTGVSCQITAISVTGVK